MSARMSVTWNEKRNLSISWRPFESSADAPPESWVRTPPRPSHPLMPWWKYWPVCDRITATAEFERIPITQLGPRNGYCTLSTPGSAEHTESPLSKKKKRTPPWKCFFSPGLVHSPWDAALNPCSRIRKTKLTRGIEQRRGGETDCSM